MSTPTISDLFLEEKAYEAECFKATYGNLNGFDSHWQQKEAECLVRAKDKLDQARAAARKANDTKPADHSGLKRSQMSVKEKADFVEAHGAEAFQALPA